ncbi:MAG: SMC-Scp complex subunit ScpB [Alphaproteobacteria bacterium]|nr:SMC-Scp complex subunit ScpB [Alphaproteobacteria bacterium]
MSDGKRSDGVPQDLEAIRTAVARLSKANARAQADLHEVAEPETRVSSSYAASSEEAVPDGRLADAMRRAEAVLFASAEPLDAATLNAALPPGVEAGDVLLRLKAEYAVRGVHLVELAGKWRFQTAADLAFLFESTREQPRALSRAALETLAIIAYCQPVTRAEIEDVRGVAVSKGTVDVLMEAGWVRPRGRRRSPGRPVTYGTTDGFLVHFGLDALDSLPGRDDLRAAGLLSAEIPRDFEFAGSPRDLETGDLSIEDPFEPAEFQINFMQDGDES